MGIYGVTCRLGVVVAAEMEGAERIRPASLLLLFSRECAAAATAMNLTGGAASARGTGVAARARQVFAERSFVMRVYRRPAGAGRAPRAGGWNSASFTGTLVFTDFTVSVQPMPPPHQSVL
jgi:hypothetical protein